MKSEEDSQKALEDFRKELSIKNPTFLETIESRSDEFISQWREAGESGQIFLMFTAIKISALAESGEL